MARAVTTILPPPEPKARPQPLRLAEDAKRDIEEVHRSVSDAAARLQESRALLEAYLAKMSAERSVGVVVLSAAE
jgi:hypothetical protein